MISTCKDLPEWHARIWAAAFAQVRQRELFTPAISFDAADELAFAMLTGGMFSMVPIRPCGSCRPPRRLA